MLHSKVLSLCIEKLRHWNALWTNSTQSPDDGGSNLLWNVIGFYVATLRNIPEDSYLHARPRENLKSEITDVCLIELVGWNVCQVQ
jgi:hypothetical protein